MGNIVTILLVVAAGLLPTLGILFLLKSKHTTVGRIIEPLAGPRYRDGAVTYDQFEGKRYNIELDIPDGGRNARYQRRHPRRQHKLMKPWEK